MVHPVDRCNFGLCREVLNSWFIATQKWVQAIYQLAMDFFQKHVFPSALPRTIAELNSNDVEVVAEKISAYVMTRLDVGVTAGVAIPGCTYESTQGHMPVIGMSYDRHHEILVSLKEGIVNILREKLANPTDFTNQGVDLLLRNTQTSAGILSGAVSLHKIRENFSAFNLGCINWLFRLRVSPERSAEDRCLTFAMVELLNGCLIRNSIFSVGDARKCVEKGFVDTFGT